PLRQTCHTFTSIDYIAYRERCTTILRYPRARAALMHGADMWRLAMNNVPWELVFQGPAGQPDSVDGRVVVQDEKTGMELVDDTLSEKEQDCLCGTYVLPTGKGDQTALVSWYMPPTLKEKAAENLGRWSSFSE
ncbi:hypothetical protein CPB83DRAFT_733142, partial [Crepidotus variabilis]